MLENLDRSSALVLVTLRANFDGTPGKFHELVSSSSFEVQLPTSVMSLNLGCSAYQRFEVDTLQE